MASKSKNLRAACQGAALLAALWLSGCGGSDAGLNERAVADEAKATIEEADAAESAETGAPVVSERVRALAVAATAVGITTDGFPSTHQLYPREGISDAVAT
jgi:hypothetical protein